MLFNEACENGDVKQLQKLLSKHPNIDVNQAVNSIHLF